MKTKIQKWIAFKIAFLIVVISLLTIKIHAQEVRKWDAPDSSKAIANTVAVNEESLLLGKELYAKLCKSCHGKNGKGDGPKSANLDVSCKDFTTAEFKNQSEGEIFWKTSEGKNPMPSFKSKLSEEERWQLVNYVKSLNNNK